MFRAIFYLIATVVVIGLLRAVIGAVAKLFSGSDVPAERAAPRGPTAVPVTEALKKDPVCGAYVAPSAAVEATIAGTRHYFCSAACRDKFKAA